MSANNPTIKVSSLNETTKINRVAKILDGYTNKKTGEMVYPVKLLNLEDGETFDILLSREPKGIKFDDYVDVKNVSITNYPTKQRFGKEEYAVSQWSYTGEEMVVVKHNQTTSTETSTGQQGTPRNNQ